MKRLILLVVVSALSFSIGCQKRSLLQDMKASAGKNRIAVNTAKQQILAIKTALSQYEMDTGGFPTTEQGLQALVTCPTSIAQKDWHGPYLDTIPKDPWHNAYVYKNPGKHNQLFDLYSLGPDQKEGTPDDITNLKKESR